MGSIRDRLGGAGVVHGSDVGNGELLLARAGGKCEVELIAVRVDGARGDLFARGIRHHIARAGLEFLAVTQFVAELISGHIGLDASRVQLDGPLDVVVGAVGVRRLLDHLILDLLRVLLTGGAIVLALAAPLPRRRVAHSGDLLAVLERVEGELLHHGLVLDVIVALRKLSKGNRRFLAVQIHVALACNRMAAFVHEFEGVGDEVEIRADDVLDLQIGSGRRRGNLDRPGIGVVGSVELRGTPFIVEVGTELIARNVPVFGVDHRRGNGAREVHRHLFVVARLVGVQVELEVDVGAHVRVFLA